MAFVETKYQSDQGVVMGLRMSDDEFAAITAPTGAQDFAAHCYTSVSRRRFGIHARFVTLSRTVGTAPNTFKKTIRLSIPTTTEFDGMEIGDPVTVGGTAYTVSFKTAEIAV